MDIQKSQIGELQLLNLGKTLEKKFKCFLDILISNKTIPKIIHLSD